VTFLRYLAIQVLAYGIDMGSFLFALYFGLAGPIIANVVAKLAAGGFAFAAHRRFTFGVGGSGFLKRQAVRYFLLLAANVPIASGLLALTLLWLPAPVVAKFLSDVVGVVFTYILSKHFIFNAHTSQPVGSVSDAKT
jgi:putative flippase GtrA